MIDVCLFFIHLRRPIACSALLFVFSLPAIAQQSRPTAAAGSEQVSGSRSQQSDLAKDNLDHVAASPLLLKEVLAGDPGLMVELKRWAAQEASDHGQLVSDDDLTDDAMYDRLKRDVKFRAVATR